MYLFRKLCRSNSGVVNHPKLYGKLMELIAPAAQARLSSHFSGESSLGNPMNVLNNSGKTIPGSTATPILDSYRLSSEEAFVYVRHVLGIDSVQQKLRRDRVGLLREIVRMNHYLVPFQNVTNTCSIPVEERHLPSFEEIKFAMLARHGGVCYELNIFMNRLLHTLGYRVTLIGGKFMGQDRYHVSNIVHDLEVRGQQHLVEVGASDPTFCPIPLDFHGESRAYRESILTYKLVRTRDGLIRRLHKPVNESPDDTLFDDDSWQNGWRIMSDMDPSNPRDIDYFSETMSYVFNALPRPKLKFFNEGMFAMVYTNGRMVYFRDSNYYLEVGEDEMEHHVTSSPGQLIDAYRKYMPMIPPDLVEAGIEITSMEFPNERRYTRTFVNGAEPSVPCKEVKMAK